MTQVFATSFKPAPSNLLQEVNRRQIGEVYGATVGASVRWDPCVGVLDGLGKDALSQSMLISYHPRGLGHQLL